MPKTPRLALSSEYIQTLLAARGKLITDIDNLKLQKEAAIRAGDPSKFAALEEEIRSLQVELDALNVTIYGADPKKPTETSNMGALQKIFDDHGTDSPDDLQAIDNHLKQVEENLSKDLSNLEGQSSIAATNFNNAQAIHSQATEYQTELLASINGDTPELSPPFPTAVSRLPLYRVNPHHPAIDSAHLAAWTAKETTNQTPPNGAYHEINRLKSLPSPTTADTARIAELRKIIKHHFTEYHGFVKAVIDHQAKALRGLQLKATAAERAVSNCREQIKAVKKDRENFGTNIQYAKELDEKVNSYKWTTRLVRFLTLGAAVLTVLSFAGLIAAPLILGPALLAGGLLIDRLLSGSRPGSVSNPRTITLVALGFGGVVAAGCAAASAIALLPILTVGAFAIPFLFAMLLESKNTVGKTLSPLTPTLLRGSALVLGLGTVFTGLSLSLGAGSSAFAAVTAVSPIALPVVIAVAAVAFVGFIGKLLFKAANNKEEALKNAPTPAADPASGALPPPPPDRFKSNPLKEPTAAASAAPASKSTQDWMVGNSDLRGAMREMEMAAMKKQS